MARPHPDPHSRGTTLSEWMSSETWAQCRNLEEVNPEVYKNLGDELQTDFDWREWFELEKPETETMPGPFADLSGYVFIIHVGGTRCVTSSIENIMKICARITLTVAFIRTCIFLF
jgi:hypothetical protein